MSYPLFNTDIFTTIKEDFPPLLFEKLGCPDYAIPKSHSPYSNDTIFLKRSSVLRNWIYRPLLYLNDHTLIKPSNIVLFSWVMNDGLGDWATQITTAKIIKQELPQMKLTLVTLLSPQISPLLLKCKGIENIVLHANKNNEFTIPNYVKSIFENAHLAIQIPTYSPIFDKLTTTKQEKLVIGQYGFVSSKEFSPCTQNISMGLHSLEHGLLLASPKQTTIKKRQFFAYLKTKEGYAVYIEALICYMEKEDKDIVLHVCNLLPCLEALKENIFKRQIVVEDGNNIWCTGSQQKRLIIKCRNKMSMEQTSTTISESENFVGCRGDRSFSESISHNKFFFYETSAHGRPFLKDLIDVAKYFLLGYPSLHNYLELLLNIKNNGMQIGNLLKDNSTHFGMQKLIDLLKTKFSFNQSLIHAVKSKIVHNYYPHIKNNHSRYINNFVNGNITIYELLEYQKRNT